MNGASIFDTYTDALQFQKISSDSDIDCLKIGKLFPMFSKVVWKCYVCRLYSDCV